jgi:hypothetical protein
MVSRLGQNLTMINFIIAPLMRNNTDREAWLNNKPRQKVNAEV